MSDNNYFLKKVVLTRTKDTGTQMEGTLKVGDDFYCDTLERPDKNNQRRISCIPPGTYFVRWGFMNSISKNHYEVLNVPGRSAIFIHGGNYFLDSHGCILLGTFKDIDINKDGQEDLTGSMKALTAFENFMEKKDFYLKIVDGR